jgi:hypothetical protein
MNADARPSGLLAAALGTAAGAIILVSMVVSIRSAVKSAAERLATPET